MGLSAIFLDNGSNFISYFKPRDAAEIEFKNLNVHSLISSRLIKGKYSQKD